MRSQEELMATPAEQTVEHKLWRFAALANKAAPHPRDWKRFYEFIVVAHQRRTKWDADDIQAKLRMYGFDERHATDFAAAYWHGRCVLYTQKPRLVTEPHCGWMRKDGTRWT
jgi:hypothetical protein